MRILMNFLVSKIHPWLISAAVIKVSPIKINIIIILFAAYYSMAECDHGKDCCQHQPAVTSVIQTREEMDFERGIWNAALLGNINKVEKMVFEDGIDPNLTDNYGYTALVRIIYNLQTYFFQFLVTQDPNFKILVFLYFLIFASFLIHFRAKKARFQLDYSSITQ